MSHVSAQMTTVRLWRITETNTTFITSVHSYIVEFSLLLSSRGRWRVDFSADVTGKTIKEEQHDCMKNLNEIRDYFDKNKE